MERMGFGAILPTAGMATVAALLDGTSSRLSRQPPALVASVFYWDKFNSESLIFSEVMQRQQSAGASSDAGAVGLPAAAAAPAVELTFLAISDAVTAAVLAVMGSNVGKDTPLVGAGLDSLGECGACLAGQCLVIFNATGKACSTDKCCLRL